MPRKSLSDLTSLTSISSASPILGQSGGVTGQFQASALGGVLSIDQSQLTSINTVISSLSVGLTSVNSKTNNVSTITTSINSKVNAVSTNLTSVNTRIGTVSGNTTSINARIATVSGNTTSVNTRIVGVSGNVTSVNSRIAAVSSLVGSGAASGISVQDSFGFFPQASTVEDVLRNISNYTYYLELVEGSVGNVSAAEVNSSRISAALAAASATGGRVIAPIPQTFPYWAVNRKAIISDAIVFESFGNPSEIYAQKCVSNTSVLVDPPRAYSATFRPTSGVSVFLECNGEGFSSKGFGIRNITIDARNMSEATSARGVELQGSWSFVIDNVHVINPPNNNFSCFERTEDVGTAQGRFIDCFAGSFFNEGPLSKLGNGYKLSGTAGTRTIFDNCWFRTTNFGWYFLQGGRGIKLNDCAGESPGTDGVFVVSTIGTIEVEIDGGEFTGAGRYNFNGPMTIENASPGGASVADYFNGPYHRFLDVATSTVVVRDITTRFDSTTGDAIEYQWFANTSSLTNVQFGGLTWEMLDDDASSKDSRFSILVATGNSRQKWFQFGPGFSIGENVTPSGKSTITMGEETSLGAPVAPAEGVTLLVTDNGTTKSLGAIWADGSRTTFANPNKSLQRGPGPTLTVVNNAISVTHDFHTIISSTNPNIEKIFCSVVGQEFVLQSLKNDGTITIVHLASAGAEGDIYTEANTSSILNNKRDVWSGFKNQTNPVITETRLINHS